MQSLTGIQKTLIAFVLIALLGGAYFFYQTGASTFLGLTLTTNPDLNRGLVLHYTFDGPDMDWASSTAEIRDTSGNGINGNTESTFSSTTSGIPGMLGQALRFDGTDDSIYSTASSTMISNMTKGSISFWLNPRTMPYYGQVFSTLTADGGGNGAFIEGFMVSADSWGGTQSIRFVAAGSTASMQARSTTALQIDTWVHVTVVWDGSLVSANTKFYINGNLDTATSFTDGSGTYVPSVGNYRIGISSSGFSLHLDAILDDLRVYDREISAEEVKRLYQLGATTKIDQTLNTNPDLNRGLVGYWTFDGPDFTDKVYDKSGQGNHGYVHNMASTSAKTSGALGQGLTLNGSNAFTKIAHNNVFNSYPITIATWFKYSSTSFPYQTFINHYVSASANGWMLHSYNGQLCAWYFVDSNNYIDYDNSTCNFFLPGYNDNNWHHITFTIDNSGANIFVDGEGKGFRAWHGTPGPTTTTIPLGLGTFPSDGSYLFLDSFLSGSLDDARIYNRALSADEVKRLYQLGATTKVAQTITTNPDLKRGLYAHWTFDGQHVDWGSSTAEVKDVSGNNRSGDATTTMSGVASTIPGPMGQALKFNGTSDRVYAYTGTPTFDKVTMTAWVKPNTVSGLHYVVAGDSAAVGRLRLNDDEVWFDHGAGGDYRYTTNANLQSGQWYHIVGTFDQNTDVVRIYVDGDMLTSTLENQDLTAYDAGFVIGSRGTDYFFDGAIDDVRVYNRILSPQEVKRLYGLGGGDVAFTCGKSMVLDADDNAYNTVAIGSQCWMKQNMRVGTRISGGTNQTNNATIEKWCYGDTDAGCTYVQSTTSPAHTQPDGGLYQWNEAMQYSTTAGAQGICPSGWHIPTHDEFTTLERAVCTSGSCATDFPYDTTTTGFRGTTEGTKLKATGSSGFEGNLAGYGFSSSFFIRGAGGAWWSSLESGSDAWVRSLDSGSAQTYRVADSKSLGWSVRCIKNN